MRRAWPPSGGRVRASRGGRSREVGAVSARDVGGLAGQWRAGARAVVRGVSVGVRHGPEQLPSGLTPRGIPWGYAYASTGRVGSRPNLSAGCGLGFVLRGSWPSSISPRRQPLEPPHGAISEVISPDPSRTPLPEPRATPVVRDLGLLRTPSAHPRPLDGVDHVPRTHLGARQRARRGGARRHVRARARRVLSINPKNLVSLRAAGRPAARRSCSLRPLTPQL